MPKNLTGGKHKQNKNKVVSKVRKLDEISRDPKALEVYGQVARTLGNRRFDVTCQRHDNASETVSIICALKGSYRKRIVKDAYVLVKLYDFNQTQGMIIDGYSDDELGAMKRAGYWDFPLAMEVNNDNPFSVSGADGMSGSGSDEDSSGSDDDSEDPRNQVPKQVLPTEDIDNI
jgi:translation initiation factor IF-1